MAKTFGWRLDYIMHDISWPALMLIVDGLPLPKSLDKDSKPDTPGEHCDLSKLSMIGIGPPNA